MQVTPRKRAIAALVVIALIIPLTVYLVGKTQIFGPKASTGPINYYGRSINTFGLFGQKEIGSASKNRVGTDGMYHASGVVVDTSSTPNKIYIVDSGNNRILGFNGYDGPGPKTPDLVIGQPNFTSAFCNGDDNLGFTQPPTEATLCLMGYPAATNTAEAWLRSNIDVDSVGNLYMVDVYNDRVLEYFQPFSADKSGGKGDSIADVVWGQDNFTSNGRNKAQSPFAQAPPPTNSSLWVSNGGFGDTTGVGVSVDRDNNVWIADRFNHRVLRFPPGSRSANLVIGQPDFTTYASPTGNCSYGGTQLNKFCAPVVARVNPDTGELFVLENYSGPFRSRILVFKPPFTNGMAAYKTIVPTIPGWDDGRSLYSFQANGFNFNPYKVGEYAQGVVWVNEHWAQRATLLDMNGTVIKTIGAKAITQPGGEAQYVNCGSIFDNNHLYAPGGSLGFDNNNNIYIADEFPFKYTVWRYSLPYTLQSNGCLPDATGSLIPQGGNKPSDDTISGGFGLAVLDNQLIIQIDGGARKAWNDYMNKPFGAAPDVIQTGGMNGETLMSGGIDDQKRLWTFDQHGFIRIDQLPLTTPNQQPLATNVKLYWADDGSEIPYRESFTGSFAFDPINRAMYIVTGVGSRIMRVRNYNDFQSGRLQVDMVLGQNSKTASGCNQGRGFFSPSPSSLCEVHQIKFDHQGNLYAVDSIYECHSNDRIVVFTKESIAIAQGMFPNLAASKVFVAPNLESVGGCNKVNMPQSPVSIAFNSHNQLVIGNDGYYLDYSVPRAQRQLWFYADPLNKQTPDAFIPLNLGSAGEIAFDNQNNLIVQDHTWNRTMIINLDTDPSWLVPLNGPIPTNLPTPTTNPNASATPTPPPGASPTPTPTPAVGGANNCTMDLNEGTMVLGSNVRTTVSGTRASTSSFMSFWALGTKLGSDIQLAAQQNNTINLTWSASALYNAGPATLECRIQTTANGGTTLFAKQVHLCIITDNCQPAATATPTPIQSSPTPQPTLGATPTSGAKQTPTPIGSTPTPQPTVPLQPTPTFTPGGTQLTFTLVLQGIGTGGNQTPLHPQRPINIQVFDQSNQKVADKNSVINFSAGGTFSGTFDVGSLQAGDYTVKVKSDRYLRKLFPGIQRLTSGANTLLANSSLTLLVGDINGDNRLDILDYNILRDCGYGAITPLPMTDPASAFTQASCSQHPERANADLDDNGVINSVDYNYFIRNIATQSGD